MGTKGKVGLGVVAALGASVIIAAVIIHHHPVSEVAAGIALVSADGRTVTVPNHSYSCFTPATLVVSESPRTASVLERTTTDSPVVSCDRSPGTLTVRLRQPLGRRELIDATTGRRLPWCDQGSELTPALLAMASPPRATKTAPAPRGRRRTRSWPGWIFRDRGSFVEHSRKVTTRCSPFREVDLRSRQFTAARIP
jgi:hypothetical protein